MIIKSQIGKLVLGAMLIPSILTAEEPLDWPEAVDSKFEEILNTKKAAMNFPSMRSENGVLGKRIETLMGELGRMIADSALIRRIEAREGQDIKAKIALWAVDLRNRPEDYKRFAKYYVNRPIGKANVIEYFNRNPQGVPSEPDPFAGPDMPENSVPRPGTWSPNPIDKADQCDKFRLILEYHFFMPPTGQSFDQDYYRGSISRSLKDINNIEKSLIIWITDAQLAVEAIKLSQLESFPIGNATSIVSLSDIPSAASYSTLAGLWQFQISKDVISKYFEKKFGGMMTPDSNQPDLVKYNRWKELAQRPTEIPSEQRFSSWILSLDDHFDE